MPDETTLSKTVRAPIGWTQKKSRSIYKRIRSLWNRLCKEIIAYQLFRWELMTTDEMEKENRHQAIKKIYTALETRSPTLDLSNLGLSCLSKQICALSKLTSLNLSNNELEQLPKLGQLKRLKILNLSGNNELQTLPPNFYQLEKLESLNLNGTGLQKLSSQVSDLKALKILLLDDTHLQTLPKAVEKLKNLEKLSLQGVRLSRKKTDKFVEILDKLSSLKELQLSNLAFAKQLKKHPKFDAMTRRLEVKIHFDQKQTKPWESNQAEYTEKIHSPTAPSEPLACCNYNNDDYNDNEKTAKLGLLMQATSTPNSASTDLMQSPLQQVNVTISASTQPAQLTSPQ